MKSLNIKKFSFSILFLNIFFLLLSPALANAACLWTVTKTESTYSVAGMTSVLTTKSGTCADKKMVEAGDEKCSAASKPKAEASKLEDAVCCCDAVTNATAQEKKALFTIPDFQVKIPGLDKLATVTCTVGQECNIPWIGQYIAGVYNYALAIVGIIAAIVLMAGGLLWLISAGDASKITQAKELIIGSISGLIILIASYTLLITINPDLVNLGGVKVTSVERVDLEPVSDEGNTTGSKECNNCTTLQVPTKNGQKANSSLSQKLTSAYTAATKAGLNWRVTEAYPWTSEHKSKCHYNGMCVDIALTSNATCDNVNKLITILQNSGLNVLNEYTGCGGEKTTYTTGGHLHVK